MQHPRLIDTHCHLDDEAFADDLDDVLTRSTEAGVTGWLLIGYAPAKWDAVVALTEAYPGMKHALGVHPGNAKEWEPGLEAQLCEAAERSGAVAIGECGLDFYRDNAPLAIQQAALEAQLRVARELALPAIFHLRDAEPEMLAILGAQADLPTMVFHSFDGSSALTDFILDRQAFIGVGGLATRQKSDALREQLRRIPLDRMVLETDSPYLVPARQKDRRNVPAHIRTIAAWLADFLDVSLDRVADVTTANAATLFGGF